MALTLVAIISLGLALRLIQLDFQPLWWDEGYSVFFATRDFGVMLARTAVDIHPPLYYALMQLWLLAFGKDAVALRLLSVAIGVAAIPLLYLVAKRLFGRRTALAAAFLFAIAPLQIYYAQELRMYGLVTALTLASAALQLALLEREIRDWRLELGYVLVTAAALYTQYLAAFIIVAQIAIVLFLQFRQFPVSPRKWFVRWLIVLALYLPWVIYAGPKLYAYVTAKVGIEQYSRLDPLTYLTQHFAAFSIGHVSEWTWLVWGAVVFVALAGLGIWEAGKQGSREAGKQGSRETGKQGSREAGKQGNREIGKQGDREAGKQGDREAGKQGNREIGKQGNREIGKQGNREIGKQGNREIGKQGNREIGNTYLSTYLPAYLSTCLPTRLSTYLPAYPSTNLLLTCIYLFVPLLLGFFVNLVYTFHPLRYERLLLFAAPFFMILVARGIVALYERQRALGYAASALVVILCALSLYDFYTVTRYPDEDYRPLIVEMEKYASENDLVYAVYPWQIGYLETYYRGAPLNVFEAPSEAWIKNAAAMNRETSAMRETNARAWILAYQKQGRILEDRLVNEYINDYMISDQTFGNTRLLYFAQGNATDFELAPMVFNADLLLRVNYAAFDPPTDAPTLALARFGWNAANDHFNFSLRVTDAAGAKLAQQDAPIPQGATTLRRALALPKNLAPGEYTLRLVVYRRADGKPLSRADGSPDVILTRVTIK